MAVLTACPTMVGNKLVLTGGSFIHTGGAPFFGYQYAMPVSKINSLTVIYSDLQKCQYACSRKVGFQTSLQDSWNMQVMNSMRSYIQPQYSCPSYSYSSFWNVCGFVKHSPSVDVYGSCLCGINVCVGGNGAPYGP